MAKAALFISSVIALLCCASFLPELLHGVLQKAPYKSGFFNRYNRPSEKSTERPIIGILTLPVTVKHQRRFGNASFATSYARWFEAGGARIAPIFYDSSPEQLKYILNRVNGVFFTGGLVEFNPTLTDPEGAKYLKTTEAIMEHVLSENRNGNYYPFWGTCLGFERMNQLLAQDPNATILTTVDAENYDINLGFTVSGWLSRMFRGMPYQLFKTVASPVGHLAFNNHGLGIDPDRYKSSPAFKIMKILSVDLDRKGKPFVSTVEGRDYPIYGSQWHPEKAPWEWSDKMAIQHSKISVEFSNYLGRFFVDECKYNKNRFESEDEEERVLIYNWRARPTGELHHLRSGYTNIYFFRHSHYVLSEEMEEARRERIASSRYLHDGSAVDGAVATA